MNLAAFPLTCLVGYNTYLLSSQPDESKNTKHPIVNLEIMVIQNSLVQ